MTQFCNCVPYHQPWSMEDSHHCFINADISLKQCILFLFLIWLLLWNTDSWRAFLFYIVYCHFSEAFLPFFTFCDNNSCIFASLLCSLLFPNFQEPSQQDLTMSPRVLVKLLTPREGKLFPYCQAFLYPNLQSTLNSHSESRTTHTVPVPHCLYLLDRSKNDFMERRLWPTSIELWHMSKENTSIILSHWDFGIVYYSSFLKLVFINKVTWTAFLELTLFTVGDYVFISIYIKNQWEISMQVSSYHE